MKLKSLLECPSLSRFLTTGLISVANNKVYCKLGNGTVRDLTLDTNTVYTHPTTKQCSGGDAGTLNGKTAAQIINEASSGNNEWITIDQRTIDMSSWLYDNVSSHTEVIISSFKSLFEQYSNIWIGADVVLRSKSIDLNHSANLDFKMLLHSITLTSDDAQWHELQTHLDIVPLITTTVSDNATIWGFQYEGFVSAENRIVLSTWYGGNGSYTGSQVTLNIKGRK